MKKYITIKKHSFEQVMVTREETVPVWWFEFLMWLFGPTKESYERMLDGQYACAWDKGMDMATTRAHSAKEEAMQAKLSELGFEVKCNFPIARQFKHDELPNPPIDPKKIWEIIKK